jgi:hypothetical protein
MSQGLVAPDRSALIAWDKTRGFAEEGQRVIY